MKRRDFLKVSAVGAAASAVASPAIAQSSPEIKWRMTSSFPKSLDTLYGASEVFAKYIADMTDNKFQIQEFPAGEIVPGLQALDETSSATVEMSHTVAYYYVGKDPTFAIYSSVPFGLNARQQNSWWYQGGGQELGNEFFKKFNLIGFPCGNTGTQMGGWFRKEIKTVADLSGLKFRIGGIAGQVLQKVAKYYYYPGFWEGGPMVHAFCNLEKWNSLPKNYQAIITNATANANAWMAARYDMENPAALKRLVASGTQLRPFTNEVLEACLKATNELWGEISAKNADFKKSIDAMQAYRSDQYLWWQVAEYTFDSFMIRSRTRG